MAIAKGTKVTQVLPAPFQGTVIGFSVDGNSGAVLNLVSYTDANGKAQTGYFTDDQLAVEA
jgi:hypothetical protein